MTAIGTESTASRVSTASVAPDAFADSPSWRRRYAELAMDLGATATASTAPFACGFTACVDALFTIDPDRLAALVAAADGSSADNPARGLCTEVLARIGSGRGGELYLEWPAGPTALDALLGEPEAIQIGGTGPQAAWALDLLGARALVALAERTSDQLQVLSAGTVLAGGDGVRTAAERRAEHAAADRGRPRHYILQFVEGTSAADLRVPRSTRIIVRFTQDAVQRDEAFADALADGSTRPRGLIVSGLSAVPTADSDSRQWLFRRLSQWRRAGIGNVHLELAEYPDRNQLPIDVADLAGVVDSLGCSWSELRMLSPTDRVEADPAQAAARVAEEYGYREVAVHFDTWALGVHRDDPMWIERKLAAGNLLASARAAAGVPTAAPVVAEDALFLSAPPGRTDLNGWTVSWVPAPWQPRPRSTIGLGDTFAAGYLLAGAVR